MRHDDLALPGSEFIQDGLDDLAAGLETVSALLVSIGAPRLRRIGLVVPREIAQPELRLYQLLQQEHGDNAHSRYNALVRRLVSFERAAECANVVQVSGEVTVAIPAAPSSPSMT